MDVKVHARRNLQLDLRNALAADAFRCTISRLQPAHRALPPVKRCCAGPIPSAPWYRRASHPIAEEMGLIVEIGRLVLRKACIECARWPNDVRVAVNLSAIQFRRDDMANTIREALQAANLAPDRLEIKSPSPPFSTTAR